MSWPEKEKEFRPFTLESLDPKEREKVAASLHSMGYPPEAWEEAFAECVRLVLIILDEDEWFRRDGIRDASDSFAADSSDAETSAS